VTASLFTTLGIEPIAGRAFSPMKTSPGRAGAVVAAPLGEALRVRSIDLGRPSASMEPIRGSWASCQMSSPFPTLRPICGFRSNWTVPGIATPASATRHRAPASGSFHEEAETEMGSILARITETYPGDLTQSMLERARMKPVLHALKQDVVGEWKRPSGFCWERSASFCSWPPRTSQPVPRPGRCTAPRGSGSNRARASRADIAVSTSRKAGARPLGGTLGLALAGVAVRLFVDFGAMELPRLDEVAIDGAVILFTVRCRFWRAFSSASFGPAPGIIPTRDRVERVRTRTHRGTGAAIRPGGAGHLPGGLRPRAPHRIGSHGAELLALAIRRTGFDPKSTLRSSSRFRKVSILEKRTGTVRTRLTEQVGALPGVAAVAITTRCSYRQLRQ
jgi:hypothetical protein